MKRLRLRGILIIALLIMLVTSKVSLADSIDSIDTNAVIEKDASISITQVWKANPDSGTEFFIPIQNLNHMQIEDFTVSDEKGPYERMNPWNVDANFSEKARKYGINQTSDGIELCFGKTEFKDKTYTIRYKFKNAVTSFNDYDGFNIRFVNDKMDPSPDKVSLKISLSDGKLNKDNAKVWGFGYDGNVNLENGKIVAKTKKFDSSNYMNIMLSLNKGIISPNHTSNKSIDTLVNKAFEGSDYSYDDYKNGGVYDKGGTPTSTIDKIFGVFTAVMGVIGVSLGIFAIVNPNRNKNIKNVGKVDRKKPQYHREIPFEKNLMANFYAYNGKENMVENILSATLLVWLRDGNIDFTTSHEKSAILRRDIEKYNIQILKEPEFNSDYEQLLFSSLQEASGDDVTLTEKEYKDFLKDDDDFLERIIKSIEKDGKKFLLDNEYIENSRGMFRKYSYTQKGLQEAALIPAFERFLKDFTLINEREPIEVALWDEVLIGATLFGKGEETLRQFKKFYPDYTFGSFDRDIYTSYWYLNHFSNNTYSSAIANSQSSAGYGGGASIGGGGGFSGGGSGGGGR